MQHSVEVPGASSIVLDDGVLEPLKLDSKTGIVFSRRCYAASHIALLPGYAEVSHSLDSPGKPEDFVEWIDWDHCASYRRRLDDFGFGIAEAMDTAQRFELGWAGAKKLMEATSKLKLANGFIGAASADHADSISSKADLSRAIAEQIQFIQSVDGIPIVLPQPWLTKIGANEEDYARVYCDAIDACDGPILLHWLSEEFHPGMRGYFPGESLRTILNHDPKKVRGMKVSMLDRELEETLRASIAPNDQVILTGDDYNFVPLIEGHSQESRALPSLGGRPLPGGEFSHALLGILNAIAVPASLALRHLSQGSVAAYRQIMEPCEALSREIFKAPVSHYKAGVAFLAWLNGHQPNAMLVNHEEAARSTDDYVRIAELASAAGAIEDAGAAAERLQGFLTAASL
jgi:hypothetical protein